MNDQRGSLSSTSLWILALLSLLGIGLAHHTLLQLQSENYAAQVREARWLARAGAWHAVAVLMNAVDTGDSLRYDAFSQEWAHSPVLFRQVPCGSGKFEVGYTIAGDYQGVNDFYGIIDEERKINLNLAPEEVLLRLPGMTPEKVAALLDWRDVDEEAREGGAESAYYQALTHPYPCKNGDLESLEELTRIRGFAEADVERLRPFATVYGEGSVNINTAPVEVLECLGISPEVSRQIVRLRWGDDGVPFTDDDVVFKNPVTVVSILADRLALSPEDQMYLNGLLAGGRLGVASTYFTIHSVGLALGGKIRRRVLVTVRRRGLNGVEVIRWVEEGRQLIETM